MLQSNYNGMAGPGTTYTQQFKEILASQDLASRYYGGVRLAQGFGVVSKGRVLGKITASGLFAPYTSTTLAANAALNATSLSFTDASAFIVGDTIIVGAANPIAITGINGNTVTVAAPGLSAAQTSGAAITTNDGRSTAVCILDNDQDTTINTVDASAFDSGKFIKSAILGLDSNAQTALKMCMFY